MEKLGNYRNDLAKKIKEEPDDKEKREILNEAEKTEEHLLTKLGLRIATNLDRQALLEKKEQRRELLNRVVEIQFEKEEAFNNKGERIFEQTHIKNHNIIYEGWGQSIFEDGGVIYSFDSKGKLFALPREISSKLLKTEWAFSDIEDKSMSDQGDKLGFPNELFELEGIEIPKENVRYVDENGKDLNPHLKSGIGGVQQNIEHARKILQEILKQPTEKELENYILDAYVFPSGYLLRSGSGDLQKDLAIIIREKNGFRVKSKTGNKEEMFLDKEKVEDSYIKRKTSDIMNLQAIIQKREEIIKEMQGDN